MRLFVVACRMRHLALWAGHGRFGVVVIWPLFVPRRGTPYFWLALPAATGGTLNARAGGLVLVWRLW